MLASGKVDSSGKGAQALSAEPNKVGTRIPPPTPSIRATHVYHMGHSAPGHRPEFLLRASPCPSICPFARQSHCLGFWGRDPGVEVHRTQRNRVGDWSTQHVFLIRKISLQVTDVSKDPVGQSKPSVGSWLHPVASVGGGRNPLFPLCLGGQGQQWAAGTLPPRGQLCASVWALML